MEIKLNQNTGIEPHLKYRGGKVLDNPSLVNIYAGSYWSTVGGKKETSFLDTFSKKLLASRYTSTWREYGGGRGTFLGSSNQALPLNKRSISESDIQEGVFASIRDKKVQAPNGQTIYTVFLPPGAVLEASDGTTSLNGLGGYHGSFKMKGTSVYYAAIAYSTKGNGIEFTDRAKDNVTITASHEWAEAITDPDVNSGKLGWYDDRYGEVGDIPIAIGTPLKHVFGRVAGYAVQKEWSNSEGKAILSR